MWLIIIAAVIIVAAAALLFAGFFFYGVAINRAPKEFLASSPDLKLDPPVAGASWGKGPSGFPASISGMSSWCRMTACN